MNKNMNFCIECGEKLIIKPLKGEGDVTYCSKCDKHRFPIFNVACSMIVMNSD